MSNDTGFIYQVGSDNIAVVIMDMPGQPVNTMNDAYLGYMAAALKSIKADLDKIKGVVLTSAKKTFFAGGDIGSIMETKKNEAWDQSFEFNLALKNQLSELENLGIPVVAAINGAAMGGGFEICLACHYRIALDSKAFVIALPEVSLGLLPAAGGVVRGVRLLGLQKAMPLLVEGKKYNATKALEAGLVHELAATPEEMMIKAKAWILANPESTQPWFVKGYQIPGGDSFKPHNAMMLAGAPAMLRVKTKGLLPAPEAILSVMSESTMCGYESAMLLESRYFEKLIRSPESTSLIGTMYYQMNEIAAGKSRPKAIEPQVCKKLGVLGAGMMGRGIAYCSAVAGMQVVLKDISVENAEAGKDYSRKLLDKQIKRGRMTEEKRDAILELIIPSASNEDLGDCDMVIEAVFEDLDLKIKLTQGLEPFLKADVVWGSNTSTLPITLLAAGFSDPSRFIGVHFFSPVDKMNLVEIICGEKSNDHTLAVAYDYVRQIKKSPIVVQDGRGFYTSRVFGCFIDEGLHMLQEGVDPTTLENIAKQTGMPVGPLSVMDEVELELMRKVGVTNKDLDERLGEDFCVTHKTMTTIADEMCALGRSGRGVGKGWYDYNADGSKVLWPELKARYGGDNAMPLKDIADRLMFRQVNETLDCISRGVLNSARDANIGSIFGWGFPVHTGGAVQFLNWFGGNDAYEARRKELVAEYGDRFELPEQLEAILAKLGE